jgi:uracil-DNA glycosylase family 4
MTNCEDCTLCETRTQIVPAFGKKDAKVILVGEAPGASEDKGGEPFIGRSGKLLMKLLKEELNLERSDVYIVNSVQCRPPNNRKPSRVELEACKKHLLSNLSNCDAKIIITLGKTASGNISEFEDKKVYVTYHPAAALYNPKLVSKIREDLSNVKID